MTSELNGMMEDAKRLLDSGKGQDEIISELQSRGCSIVDAIRIMRRVLGISLGEAKELVVHNEAWEEVVEKAQALHDELEEIAEQLTEEI